MELSGKTAIVTGGAIRIGREICRRLAREGMNICLQFRSSEEEARAAVAGFQAMGIKATAVQADFSSPIEAARTVINSAMEAHGEISLLVNNASIFETGSVLGTTETDWDRQHTINHKAPFFLTQEFIRRRKSELEGAVVNIVDWRGTHPVPGHLAYTLSKAGLVAQTKILAQELGPLVRVNAIAPGPMLRPESESREAFTARGQLNPLKRIGTATDIADAVHFAATAPFLTGEIIHVTGGEQLVIASSKLDE